MSDLTAYINLSLDQGLSYLIGTAERRSLECGFGHFTDGRLAVHHMAHCHLNDVLKLQELLAHVTSDECQLSQQQLTQILGLAPDLSEFKNRIYLCRVSAEGAIEHSRY